MSKWQQILAEQANEHGQDAVAKYLGVSKTVISQLINSKYPGDLQRMKKLVEGAYMQRTVVCPIMGELPLHQCDKHQNNTITSNPIKLRLYRACRSGCPHSTLPEQKQFKRIAIQADFSANDTPKRYSADAAYNRLERQSQTDGGGVRQLCNLLKQELKALELRYNKLIQQQAARRQHEDPKN
ncbi:helix-turn-helix domain-containing protein [Shewanella fidelis]|uniref:Helix-turn-helix transcriptional regulator n=1 Tax=Shewanella fidelis TaxID=173509 RepID=A0AAW8NLM4_9GAMM|nr:helix-turn-helix transcriptional regulator [Shewanella fidelis]MDR8523446.1 helix-turn-helix transcriptional regulator [Shewanella fidelis]MDW4813320.1 helix-turn-helix transcriptional regulator [Shewanella fidelis]MDW4817308.1 helix-turn-helix transcriptional regulator [Shewanella fidelis]MDW4821335.1 helix-turn-helix transcriptional regulator [Shewanella fidelis]MDW4824587.1 helix-turn-helix transcriptional regulator [Shewanella fidelis]